MCLSIADETANRTNPHIAEATAATVGRRRRLALFRRHFLLVTFGSVDRRVSGARQSPDAGDGLRTRPLSTSVVSGAV